MPRVLPFSESSIGEAVAVLRGGGVVGFPTETVYGLGADTYRDEALAAIFRIKGRSEDNPLIAHVSGVEVAQRLTPVWDDRCDVLAERFWPGPLTMVLRKSSDVPDRATAGWPTIAIRSPQHPVASALLEKFGGPISAPSANRSGHVSPTTAAHVAGDFADEPDLIVLDGAACSLGIESTVLDLGTDPPTILRPGAITTEALSAVVGEVAQRRRGGQQASPGTGHRHYAPAAPVEVVELSRLEQRIAEAMEPLALLGFRRPDSPVHHFAAMPGEADSYAAQLYDALREADGCGAARILIGKPPEAGGLWTAIHDRLRRMCDPEEGSTA